MDEQNKHHHLALAGVSPNFNPNEVVQDMGQGYTVNVEGNYHDIVRFYKYGVLLAEDLIRDGDNLWPDDFGFKEVKRNDDKRAYLVGVSHGTNRDLIYLYAILDYKMFRSLRWRDQKPGDVDFGCRTVPTWEFGDDNFGNLKTWCPDGNYPLLRALLDFNFQTEVWTLTPSDNDYIYSQENDPNNLTFTAFY